MSCGFAGRVETDRTAKPLHIRFRLETNTIGEAACTRTGSFETPFFLVLFSCVIRFPTLFFCCCLPFLPSKGSTSNNANRAVVDERTKRAFIKHTHTHTHSHNTRCTHSNRFQSQRQSSLALWLHRSSADEKRGKKLTAIAKHQSAPRTTGVGCSRTTESRMKAAKRLHRYDIRHRRMLLNVSECVWNLCAHTHTH